MPLYTHSVQNDGQVAGHAWSPLLVMLELHDNSIIFDKSLLYKIFFYYKTNQVPVLRSFFSSASQALYTRSWRPTCHQKAHRDIACVCESCRSRCVRDGCGDRCSKPLPLGSDLPPQHWQAHGHPCRGSTPSALYYLQMINKEVIWGWSDFKQDKKSTVESLQPPHSNLMSFFAVH